jgi:regulatory protein
MLRRSSGQSGRRSGYPGSPEPVAGDGDQPERVIAAAREAAIRMIEVQLRPRRELARRLAARGFPPPAVETALDRLEAVGLVDDRAYAEGFIRRRIRLRPRGALLLELELLRRGIARPVVTAAVAEALARRDELALARAALAKRAPAWDRLEPAVARRRAAAALRRLGFPVGVIRAALDSKP